MRKTSFWGTAVVLVSVLFASCGFFGGESNYGSFNPSGVVSSIKFDFSGAKAVAKLEDSSSRAAVTGDELGNIVKILEDGSIKSAVTVEGDINLSDSIKTVLKSPVSDDVFVVFNGTIWLGDEWDAELGIWKYSSMGGLICVRPDGTVLDILKVRDDSEYWMDNYIWLQSDTVVFDGSGNLYFAGEYAGAAGIIYKFDPLSSTLTQMVAAVEGTSYSEMQITGDGSWILVEGKRYSGSTGACFLRAIPISNPNNFVNIYYSSNGYTDKKWWIYDDKSGLVYYVSYAANYDDENAGLFTVSKVSNFQDKKFKSRYFDDGFGYVYIDNFDLTDTGVYAQYWWLGDDWYLYIIHVADESGNFVGQARKIELPSGKKIDMQRYNREIFLRYALTDSSGSETGFHHLYSIDLDTGEIINRCDNVANRNNLEIISYSVGADNLYFSAVRGTTIENHVVNLITNQSNPLSAITRKVVAFYAF